MQLEGDKPIKKQRNDEKINRYITLSIGGKLFRGHNEKTKNVHIGLFLDIVRFLRKYDPVFDQYFVSGS